MKRIRLPKFPQVKISQENGAATKSGFRKRQRFTTKKRHGFATIPPLPRTNFCFGLGRTLFSAVYTLLKSITQG